MRGRLGLPVERDHYFEADKALSEYVAKADRQHGAIRTLGGRHFGLKPSRMICSLKVLKTDTLRM